MKRTLTFILFLYTSNMNLFLRLANFLWFLDFENPSTNKDFINPQMKFNGRLISNKTETPWPPNSPDLNHLYFLGGYTIYTMYLELSQIQWKILNRLLMTLHMPWTQILWKKCATLQDQDLKKWELSSEAILNNPKLINPIEPWSWYIWLLEWMN